MSVASWRIKANTLLTKSLPVDIIRKSVETSVYNWSVLNSKSVFEHKKKKCVVDRKNFARKQKLRLLHLYRQKMRSIVYNLETNDDFAKNVLENNVDLENISNLSPCDINPSLWFPIIEKRESRRLKIEKLNEQLNERLFPKNEYDNGLFKCDSCLKKNTQHVSFQTRGADEPETTYVYCVDCDIHWKA